MPCEIEIHDADRPDNEESWERSMNARHGGLCSCEVGAPCPLNPNAKGMAPRCRANALRDALLEIQNDR